MTDTLINIDWRKAADGTAVKVVQNPVDGSLLYVNGECYFWCNNDQEWSHSKVKDWTIIANRPKPPLTDEQIEAVREFWKWWIASPEDVDVDDWIKEHSK